jgi:ABC-type bacteriocin/lantibiotic exporter with double-glycine peptidase domain
MQRAVPLDGVKIMVIDERAKTFTALMVQLWSHISFRRRGQFAVLLFLTVLTSVAEVISLGAVLPFIGVLTQPEKVFESPWLTNFIHALGIESGAQLVLPLAIGFAIAALTAGGLRLLLLWVSIRLGNAIGADLSIEVYRRTLYQSYSVHIARSSSEIISGITQKVGAATSVLISIVAVITYALLFLSIMSTLLIIDPLVATISSVCFGSAYGVIAWLTRRRLVYNSQYIAQGQTQVVKALQEGLGSIRDVLLDGTQKVYCDVYSKAILQLQRAGGENTYINQSPRYVMEALGMALIAAFVLALSQRPGGVISEIPLLGMLALGAQRLLPLMQQLYGNWSVVIGSNATLIDVLALLDQPLPMHADQPAAEPYSLKDSIRFENVSFQYTHNSPLVLDSINLTIAKGTRVGFIGSTGSGKSTALDLLMGLLDPTQGRVLVDGQPLKLEDKSSWQRTVAHVPQSIFLADTTIAENIAFGVLPNEIDFNRVRLAAQQARIGQFIESRPDGYNTVVGERGVRLSGGQRQRIGIARALYKQANLLIFDEATSALDNETEQEVMQAIESLSIDLTILIIAHRITTLKNCDVIVKLEYGKIVEQCTYTEIIEKTQSYK